MGLRGRPPEPTALKIIRGNPGKRPLPQHEPKAPPFRACPPEDLDATARREWRRFGRVLAGMKVLTDADRAALGELCRAYSIKQQADAKVQETGLIVKTPSGFVMENPLLTISRKYSDLILKYLREFGLTPSARSRVQVASAPEQFDNPFLALAK